MASTRFLESDMTDEDDLFQYVFLDDIPGYEGQYCISENGYVYNRKSKKFLSPKQINRRYYQVCLKHKNFREMLRVHVLLAMTFIPNPKKLSCVIHRDKNPSNNTVSNLRWGCHSQNYVNQTK